MSRLHISVTVPDIEKAKAFYAGMFGAQPSVERPGYAKWLLEDPRVNFVAMEGEAPGGVTHLGIEAGDESELKTLYDRFQKAGAQVLEEGKTQCCYAESEKSWTVDPAGMAWEAFLTTALTEDFGHAPDAPDLAAKAPATGGAGCCCG